jgi:hypothetical protein
MSAEQESTPNSPDLAATAPPLPRRRFQFSLASLLWLTTVAACLAAVWVMYRDLRKAKEDLQAARDEVLKYRGELGFLEIHDPKLIYARGIKPTKRNQWSWRLFLPKGHHYNLLLATKGIPPYDRLPDEPNVDRVIQNVFPGEYVLDAFAEATRDHKWCLHLGFADSDSPNDFDIVPLDEDSTEEGGIGTANQGEAVPTAGLELYRYRVYDRSEVNGHPTHPCAGFMIWIEEAK